MIFHQMQPPELVLNPGTLLYQLQAPIAVQEKKGEKLGVEEVDDTILNLKYCWICYDTDKKDALIEPCNCKGDVSSVHHDCLRRWLLQTSPKNMIFQCEICKSEYNLTRGNEKIKWTTGFTRFQGVIIAILIISIGFTIAGTWILVYLYNNTYVQMVCAAVALLTIYICLRFLGHNILSAYKRAKVATLKIDSIKKDPQPTRTDIA